MRVLFLHPDDTPEGGAWADERWDLVIDLAFASSLVYEDWGRRLGARVFSIHQFSGQTGGYRWVNDVFDHGRGRLLDRMGLDWWEILAMESYQQLQLVYLVNRIKPEVEGEHVEIAASRPHLFITIAAIVLGKSIRCFQETPRGVGNRIGRTVRAARNLRPAQIIQIAFDKWDAGYGLRRRIAGRARVGQPCVLLPSAYSNVTRSVLAYAAQLPDRPFLLATTRSSAHPANAQSNVVVAPLAAYAQAASSTRSEATELIRRWDEFLRAMSAHSEDAQTAARAGLWSYFPAHLEIGLRLREAWRSLLDSEPVTGVLCGDDLNFHTRLPLMLASQRRLRSIYCSHGALDGGFLFKQPTAARYLVKGEMESDYLTRVSSIEPAKILVGAPGQSGVGQNVSAGSAIVFFSQPYELESGRTEEIYREVLSRLLTVACQVGKKVIVKLHPFESVRGRRRLAQRVLPEQDAGLIEFVGGVLPEEVITRAWCGVTVDSSVAVECALRGIPFFLCGWLDFGGMGYLEQFGRYNVARVLASPSDLERIPEMVTNHRTDMATLDRLWHPIDPLRLEETLFSTC